MSIVFTLNGSTTLDESAGLQNAGSSGLGDQDDNDVLLSRLQTEVPEFYNRLFGAGTDQLDLDPAFPSSVGVAESADNFIEIDATGSVSNLSWTDVDGNPLDGADSGLDTLAGEDILLFTDPTNDNIVLGRVGGADGEVVFAAYIEEQTDAQGNIIGAKVWMVSLTAIEHGDLTSPDDLETILSDTLFVSASEDLEFDLSTLDSGQNDWNAFGDADNQIIVTPDDPNQTVNTSKGGGDTTIGNSNQLMDGVGSSEDADGNAMVFTFIQDTPEILTQDVQGGGYDYGDTSTIEYAALQNATGAEWSISQTQGGDDYAVATMSAYLTTQETGAPNFADDTAVSITSVTFEGVGTIRDAQGDVLTGDDLTFTEDFVGTRTVGTGKNAKTFIFEVDFTDIDPTTEVVNTVEITGLRAKDTVGYTTDGAHNRLELHNTGVDADTLDWDIGGFSISQAQPTPDQHFDFDVDITDYDGDTDTDGFGVDVDGTGIHDSGDFGDDTFLFV